VSVIRRASRSHLRREVGHLPFVTMYRSHRTRDQNANVLPTSIRRRTFNGEISLLRRCSNQSSSPGKRTVGRRAQVGTEIVAVSRYELPNQFFTGRMIRYGSKAGDVISGHRVPCWPLTQCKWPW